MAKIILNLPDNIIKEIRKESFEMGMDPTQLIAILVKLGLDVYSGKIEVLSTIEPSEDWTDDDK